jgi:hypothetical protein
VLKAGSLHHFVLLVLAPRRWLLRFHDHVIVRLRALQEIPVRMATYANSTNSYLYGESYVSGKSFRW